MVEPKRKSPHKKNTTFLSIAAWFYIVGIVSVFIIIRNLGDDWWIGTLMLFGPRWIFAAPLCILVPLSLVLNRRLLLPLFAAALFIFGPIMGFSLPIRSLFVNRSLSPDVRVLSYNVGQGTFNPSDLKILLEEVQPDITAMQECKLSTEELTTLFPKRYLHAEKGMCLISVFPIKNVASRDPMDIEKLGGSGTMVRYTLESSKGQISVVNVHLETPREGIESILDKLRSTIGEIRRSIFSDNRPIRKDQDQIMAEEGVSESVDIIDFEIFLRNLESKKAREWVDQTPAPFIVTGDFNLPMDSVIYQRYWSKLDDAFSVAGFGWGATKYTDWFGLRIDHILTSGGWEYQRAWIGPHLTGTDHRPIIADMRWIGRND